jgi:hypothetical protein
MATQGSILIFKKTDTNTFSIDKHASESDMYFSQASSLDVFFQAKSVSLVKKNAHWTYSGIKDDRLDETEASLLRELRIILSKLSEVELNILRALPVNGRVSSEMISGAFVTSDTSIRLSVATIISPAPARNNSIWTAVASLSEFEDAGDTNQHGPQAS